MRNRLISYFLIIFLIPALLWGCNPQQPTQSSTPSQPTFSPTTAPTAQETTPTETTKPITAPAELSGLFSDRDLRGDYDAASASVINLSDTVASCSSNAVTISGSTVTITDEGTYLLSGKLADGMVIVNADKDDKVQLVLSGAEIHSQTSAALYILQADKVFVTLAEGTQNSLSNGGTFIQIDENSIDAALFSKEDLTLNGSGSLQINSPAGHGIISKDELTVTGGRYTIDCASHGMGGKDSLCITGAAITVTAGKDGLHAENDEDPQLGYLYIASGTFVITTEGDGISASSWLQIQDGSFDLLCGGGSENAVQSNGNPWDGGIGGPGGRGPGDMGRPGNMGFDNPGGTASADPQEDTVSTKAIKAGGDLILHGGSFRIDSADDAIHSNANVAVIAGSYQIATGDDSFHADSAMQIAGGSVTVTESYEGIEGLTIEITGGELHIVSSDDGLNAAGGTDQSGFVGFRGNDKFATGGNSDSFIQISGGNLFIRASGDGIDSNGTLEISGGSVTVCGPTAGDTAVLDYDTTGSITGGTFIGTGSYMMAQTFSSSQQGVISLSVGNQSAGTAITLADSKGNIVVSHTPELPFAIVILSTPDMVKGETYSITIGSASGEFSAS